MVQVDTQLSTGISGLDIMLKGLIPGDNIVWRIDSVEDYKFFLKPYCESAGNIGRKVVYFRFAEHEPLVPDDCGARRLTLNPEAGFEKFISEIHDTVRTTGRGAFYIFDCLSNLARHWYSDQMLGNFFMLTCPYLFDVEAIAYFALFRERHSSDAVLHIHETSQVVIDAFRHKEKLYLHPLKVQHRHSPTMYMLHVWDGVEFLPVTQSAVISEIKMSVPWSKLEPSNYGQGFFNRTFHEARELSEAMTRGDRLSGDADEYFQLLLKMIVSRDERVLELARRYLTLSDVVEIRKRMIGTGLIGGKAAGMLIARAILRKEVEHWEKLLETHDSFYVGTDVFYEFIVRNGIWFIREKQRDPNDFLNGADEARRRMLTGNFPDSVRRQFMDMLDYFGQSPIIVRSSSLLEDSYGNAFAGKYESVFSANQGSRDKRLEDFMTAIKTIYASTMSEEALSYRAERGLLERDEQMAVLVQRVSGVMHGRRFFPQVAGVGYSYNPYVWSDHIEPGAGMLRLVLGLGTRAVNRADDDYTRVVALNAPERRPESDFDKVRKFAQRKVDVIDLDSNQLVSVHFMNIAGQSPELQLYMFASRDWELEKKVLKTGKKDVFSWVLTFDRLLTKTGFVQNMREMLKTLENAYGTSVNIEFTANFFEDDSHKINLLQCRPLRMKEDGLISELPSDVADEDLVLEARGAVIGRSRAETVDWIIYVAPSVYGKLPLSDRFSVARLVGRLMHHEELKSRRTRMLIGPGRWGSSMPALGVPVSFAEISTVSVLCEIASMHDNLVPDMSLGTHFFNDIVESDIFYLAIFPGREGNVLNERFLTESPNSLENLVPSAAGYGNAVRVIDASATGAGRALRFSANTIDRRALCYFESGDQGER
ncbi:MAG: PEP/pyruvate-binding domain-containing protein [bacterium]